MAQEQGKISSLIRLIDDRDEFVRSRVYDELVQLGTDALPFLEMAANGENAEVSIQARKIINAIQPRQLGDKFRQLVASAKGSDLDLETGVTLLAEFGYPDMAPQEITAALDQLAMELSQRTSRDDRPERVVEQLTRFLFQEKNFSGNQENYIDPENSYFNRVLQRKTGIPISLSALCVLVAERLQLPIVGVALPGHYIAKYNSPSNPIYFDPFHKGKIMDREGCVRVVQNLGHQFSEHHLLQASHRETLVRMMNNLIMIYSQNNEAQKVEQLTEYVRILLNSPSNFSTRQA
jgi:regulator of sirC expression with transglutaminase-like and TPR domain